MILVEARENTLKFHNKNNEDFFHLLRIILDTGLSEKDAREQAIRYCEEHKTDRDVIIAAAGATNTKLDYNALTKKEGNTMCTLFEKIAEEGEERGERRTTITNIQNLMETMHLTADQAMEALRISPTEQQEYRNIL
ncbi:MAG: hypothetical protein LUC32_00125 [Clostridiales bacterium]|nr:hypothetical protein [Clostridiales bacterium]